MIEFDDRDFQKGLAAAFEDFKAEAWKSELARAERIKVAAQARAPRLTGTLAESIAVTEGSDEDGRYIEVGTDDPVGIYQEFGTSVDPARPFMRPSIAENSE